MLYFFYLNLGCSGLAGRPPMHCPVLHSPSPNLHAARWTDGPRDRRMDGWKDDGHMRISRGREALYVRKQSNRVFRDYDVANFARQWYLEAINYVMRRSILQKKHEPTQKIKFLIKN